MTEVGGGEGDIGKEGIKEEETGVRRSTWEVADGIVAVGQFSRFGNILCYIVHNILSSCWLQG